MRNLVIAAVAAALLADGADAQRMVQPGPGAGYPVPGRVPAAPPPESHQAQRIGLPRGYRPGQQWQMHDGRWLGGVNAPGGWSAYRRPYRGWALPGYWTQPSFAIADWPAYGLAQPPYGYMWSRYYDDAVLIDGHGSIYDMVEGVDWDRDYADRRGDDSSEAAAGDAIDGNRDRHRPAPPPRYGARYRSPGYASDHALPPQMGRDDRWQSPDGRTTVVTTTAGGYGGGTTTVVVQSAPVVTTTTTDIYEDAVTYTRPVARPAARKATRRRWAPTKTICRCR